MAVRNQNKNSRKSSSYKIITHNDIRYYLQVGDYQVKNVIYTANKNILNGKLIAPKEMIKTGKTILVTCNGKGNYEFETL